MVGVFDGQFSILKGGEISMGKSLAVKNEIIAGLKQTLSESQLVIAIDYTGLTVAEITDLRRRLRRKAALAK